MTIARRFLWGMAILVVLVSHEILSARTASSVDFLTWDRIDAFPDAGDSIRQLAGCFAGIQGDVILLAGGRGCMPDDPAVGGTSSYSDSIFVLPLSETHDTWQELGVRLPHPLAHGLSISTDKGLICLGGCDADQCYRDCYYLVWDADSETVRIEPLPPLPVPLAYMAGDAVGSKILVAGGMQNVSSGNPAPTNHFFMLDLADEGSEQFKWRSLPSWPGKARSQAIAAVQSDGSTDAFYLFGGRHLSSGDASVQGLTDGYKYDILRQEWQQLDDTADADGDTLLLAAGAVWTNGANHILVAGGLKDPQAIYAYHTITDTWVRVGSLPEAVDWPTALRWPTLGYDDILLVGTKIEGDSCLGVIERGHPDRQVKFGLVNYTALGVYLAILVVVGVYFSRRMHDTNDFFKAGQRIPWWAAALSIYGTQLSAISFMAIPAKTYATDWRYFAGVFSILLVAPLVVYFFLPYYRRLNITTAYDYLELRFNLLIRLLGSTMFILLQLGRMGVVLYLPSIALSVVTGIDLHVCILIMGLLCIFYTVMGGMEAVIWTDVVQVLVLSAGALACMFIIPSRIEGGWGGMIDVMQSAEKLRLLDFRLSLADATFFVLFFGALGGSIISYGTDQTVIQRYLTTATEKQAARSIWISTAITIPSSALFFLIGSALYAFYQTHPQQLSPLMPQTDAIFPHFIVTELPAGLAGMVIAAIFAAAMSSLDSSMNSVSAALTTDFYKRLVKSATEAKAFKVARWSTLAIGLVGTGLALLMAQFDIKSLWDQFSAIIGLFGGGLAGVFLLGIFTKRTGSWAALVGLLASGGVQLGLQYYTHVHVWAYALSGIMSCFVIGWLCSCVLPDRVVRTDRLRI